MESRPLRQCGKNCRLSLRERTCFRGAKADNDAADGLGRPSYIAICMALTLAITANSFAQEKPEKTSPAFRPPASALEIFTKYDIGPSQLAGFFSGQPVTPAEEDVLAKILFRWSDLGQENVESWRKKGVTWDQLIAAAANHRGEIYHIRGRATHVAQVKLAPAVAERLDFEHYFVATIKIQDSPSIAVVYASFVPAAWKLDAEIDEPVSLDGMFLKVGDAAADTPPLIFATERIAWHPDKPHPEVNVGPDQIALAHAGVDWGLYEVVKAENGRRIGGLDREPFFQTLTVFTGEKGKQLAKPEKKVDIPLLLQKSESMFGNRLKLRGIAQRIVKINVAAGDVHKRFGIDHYYEIDVSITLDKPMKVAKNPKDKDALLYANTFPVALIVPNLPPNLQEGENLHDLIEADGTFYKLWTYQSSYAGQKNMRQAAPLLMAADVRLVKRGDPASAVGGVVVTIAMVLAGGTFFVLYWWFRLSDRRSKSTSPAVSIRDALRKGAEQAASEKPNFEGLK
jgi:hypothetical protein